MSNLSQSDLILAGRFVDGDLPVHESAQAEARIAKDADFAAAVEQIRDQSSLLGRLPKFTPSDDLADRTLQASMDQVKAIMGVWPIESDGEKVSVSPEAAEKSFDWKSTAALVASLAGLFVVGAILWQGQFSPESESDLAMSEAPPISTVRGERTDDKMPKKMPGIESEADEMEAGAEPSFAASEIQKQLIAKSDQGNSGDEIFSKAAPQQVASTTAIPGRGMALSGTPMTPPANPKQTQNAELANASTPVSQIWYVSQDSTASKGSVFAILNSNEIAVQREEAPSAQTPDAVEAFYVAATPNQMKLAISQISTNANIEMIEIPTVNSPIADAIQNQFAQSNAIKKPNIGVPNRNLPPKFQRSQAMGQQLFSNMVPRGIPGPVPPILESGAKIEGLNNAITPAELAMDSNAKALLPAPASKAGGGFDGMGMGMGGMGGGGNMRAAEEETMKKQVANPQQKAQQAIRTTAQRAELDKFLDDSEQLQQYLILVRGGEKSDR